MKGRIGVCVVLFIGLTAAKRFIPEHPQALRLWAGEILTSGVEYGGIVETLGSKIADTGFGWELIEVMLERPEDENNEALIKSGMEREEAIREAIAPAREESREAQPEADPTDGEELPEAVSAFLAAQAQYPGYELPENVRADMPALPFAYISPVDGQESSGFGFRLHPIENVVKFHYGTDFAANTGDAVGAFADGYVYAAGTSAGYGNYLILTHEGGFATIYAHLSAFNIQEGDMVRRGETIGYVGQTGSATGPHLHFELLLDDVYINPEYYL